MTRFGEILRGIVATIDRRGLKRHFLRKHRLEVERFYRHLSRTIYQSEAALKCKERFEKNREKLFTFLDHDGVPWNNNNVEHAIKAFARLRRAIEGLSTPKGIEEYLILLSVCQPANTWAWTFWISSVRERRTFTPSRVAGAGAKSLSVNSKSADSVSGTQSSASQPF